MACFKYIIRNGGNEVATGEYIKDLTGTTGFWKCNPRSSISISGVREDSITGFEESYFQYYVSAIKDTPCTPSGVSNCGVQINEVITTPNDSLTNIPNGVANIQINESEVGYEFSVDGTFYGVSKLFGGLKGNTNYIAYVRKVIDYNCFHSLPFFIGQAVETLFASAETIKNVTTVGGTDGEVEIKIVSGSGNYTVKFSHDNIVINLASGESNQSMVKVALPSATYTITVTDLANGAEQILTAIVGQPQVIIETYPGNYFHVPVMNSLQFVIEDLNALQNLNNRLLVNQRYPKFKKSNYYQPVCKTDPLITQFNSNFKFSKCELFTYPAKKIVKSFPPAILREKNIGKTTVYPMRLENHTDPGLTRVYFAEGPPPIVIDKDLNFELLNNDDGYNGIYKPVGIETDVNLGYQYILINKVWTITPGINTIYATGKFISSKTMFDVYEFVHSFVDVASGCYCIRLTAFDEKNSYVAESEPISLKVEHADHVLYQYRNIDNSFGLTFNYGYVGRCWLPGLFGHKINIGGEKKTTRNSNYNLINVDAKATRGIPFELFMLPMYMHQKVNVSMRYDFFSINNTPCQTEIGLTEPQYINRFLLANSSALVEDVLFEQHNSDDLGNLTEDYLIIGNGGFIRYK